MPTSSSIVKTPPTKALRKNGKSWHPTRTPFRPSSGLTSYAKRQQAQQRTNAMREHEREMKAEKEAARERFVEGIKERRRKKEEQVRFEKMEEKMHRRRVERLKRREKRNKLLGK
ncbi:MAG: hypothetical protein Q9227_003581 [Pyrenula ochraceoflavens]